jgi:hypothetical protein
MAAVLAGARIGKRLARHRGQAECVIELAVRQQSRIGRDHGAAKLQYHLRSKSSLRTSSFDSPAGAIAASPIPDKLLIAISESRRALPKSARHPGNAG